MDFGLIAKQLHGQRGVSRPAPAVALNAADPPLVVVFDLDPRVLRDNMRYH